MTEGQVPRGDSGGAADDAERTQVLGNIADNGPERTEMIGPPQPQSPTAPPRSPAGGFPPPGPPPGGFNPHQGGGQAPGGFAPRQGGGPAPGGFSPHQGGGPAPGGFNPHQGGGPAPGGFNPGGQPGGGFGAPAPNAPSAGFGGAAEDPNDKMVGQAAAACAAFFGFVAVILTLTAIGAVFEFSTGAGLLSLLLLALYIGMATGGVLIFLRKPNAHLIAGGCAGAAAVIQLINLMIFFTGVGLVIMLLLAVTAGLSFIPQTARYVRGGSSPGFGQQQAPQGGFGRPF